MSSSENFDPSGGGGPRWSQGYASAGGYPAAHSGSHSGPERYGTEPPEPGAATGANLSAGVGDVLVAAGGLLFFIGSFLAWISLDVDFGIDTPCAAFSDPQIRASCEEIFGAVTNGGSANAWDLFLMSAAAGLMILLAFAAVGLGLRLLPASRTLRLGLTAAVLVVDVIMLSFITVFDLSSLGSTFSEDALGSPIGLGGAPGARGLPSLSLDLGFWLALGGLVAANVGALVGQRRSREPRRPVS